MRHEHERQITRGMHLAATLPEVMPDQADLRIAPIYEDIQRTLRVPVVNLIFRTLANYPDFLRQAWAQLAPVGRMPAFEKAADEIRAAALLESAGETTGVEWERLGDLDTIRAFNDTIHYVLPKLLLIATAFDEMAFRAQSRERGGGRALEDTSGIAPGVAHGTTKVEMVDPEKAATRVRELFESIKERHGHPLVSSYYRGLGNWPDFLEAIWERTKPLVGSSAYEARKEQLIRDARGAVRDLPIAGSPPTGANDQQREEIRDILAAFRLKFIPEMLIDASLTKAMIDGSEAARSSRFSAAR